MGTNGIRLPRVFACLLAICILCLLTACGGSGTAGADQQSRQQENEMQSDAGEAAASGAETPNEPAKPDEPARPDASKEPDETVKPDVQEQPEIQEPDEQEQPESGAVDETLPPLPEGEWASSRREYPYGNEYLNQTYDLTKDALVRYVEELTNAGFTANVSEAADGVAGGRYLYNFRAKDESRNATVVVSLVTIPGNEDLLLSTVKVLFQR